jgi:hypothetical protein
MSKGTIVSAVINDRIISDGQGPIDPNKVMSAYYRDATDFPLFLADVCKTLKTKSYTFTYDNDFVRKHYGSKLGLLIIAVRDNTEPTAA